MYVWTDAPTRHLIVKRVSACILLFKIREILIPVKSLILCVRNKYNVRFYSEKNSLHYQTTHNAEVLSSVCLIKQIVIQEAI